MNTVEKIHREFDTAENRLLAQAQKICDTDMIKDDVAERLTRIGFINTPKVTKASVKRSQVVKSRQDATLINYYKQEYPFLKFLTEPELNRICKKYRLVYKPIENYCKDVPVKNIKDIENAKERWEADTPEDRIYSVLKKDCEVFLFAGSGGSWCGLWGREWYKIPKRIEGKHFINQFDADDYLQKKLGFKTKYLVSSVKNFTQDRQGLFIAAPKSHFKGKDKSLSFFEVKDPIVFRFVKGGVQVITKWGAEASDPALLNEVDN